MLWPPDGMVLLCPELPAGAAVLAGGIGVVVRVVEFCARAGRPAAMRAATATPLRTYFIRGSFRENMPIDRTSLRSGVHKTTCPRLRSASTPSGIDAGQRRAMLPPCRHCEEQRDEAVSRLKGATPGGS